MDFNKLEELSLEYLSTQIEPIEYLQLCLRLFEENALTFDKISVCYFNIYMIYLGKALDSSIL